MWIMHHNFINITLTLKKIDRWLTYIIQKMHTLKKHYRLKYNLILFEMVFHFTV